MRTPLTIVSAVAALAAWFGAHADTVSIVDSTPCLYQYRYWFFGDRLKNKPFFRPSEFTAEQCALAQKVNDTLVKDSEKEIEAAIQKEADESAARAIITQGYQRAQAAGKANGVHIPVNFDWTARIYFRKDWCPDSATLKTLQSDHLVVMNECCIEFAEPATPEAAWRTRHPSLQRFTTENPDGAACRPVSDTQREAGAKAQAAAEAAAAAQSQKALRAASIAEETERLPTFLRSLDEVDLCVRYGELIRDGELRGFAYLAMGLATPMRREMQRRGLRANDADAKAESFRVGSTECTVYAALGDPDDVNRTVSASRVSKQLVYRNPRIYVYTVNGLVTSWQD